MSQQGMVIDSLEFARQGGKLEGRLKPGDLSRLADVLSDRDGELAFAVAGETDGDGKPFLLLEIDGALNLRCQRCLGALAFAVRIRSRLTLIEPGAAWPDEGLEDDSSDAVPLDRALDLLPLLEEEVLLALPIAPRHDACASPEYRDEAGSASPFAALARLKRTRPTD